LAAAQLDQDQVAAALDSSRQAVALYPPDATIYLAIARTERARILALSGHIAEARALLASAARVADAGGNRGLRLAYHEQLGRIAIAIGDYGLARSEERTLQGLRREHTQGSVERQLGALRARLEQEELARDNATLREKAELTARAARMTKMAFVLGALLLIGLAWAYRRQSHLARRLETMTQTDALTGVLNRRGLFDIGRRQLERCRHDGKPFVVLVVDIDHFKRINDEFGHRAGDDALECVARVLQQNVRPGDHVGRYGGEEFAVIFPATLVEQARATAERLRQAVGTMDPSWSVRAQRVTVSGGLAFDAGDGNFERLVEIADRALYRAKELGRDRIECDPGDAGAQAEAHRTCAASG
ncbi:MAG TPA: GGDEF domain-containing protein, partial [Rhizomicrobium sp.]|nr:GGDEF domain-containing protein [Rhizomicrobium sp.]